ncbi:unnamed protein product [Callosobruchus maculatus]|uniref:Uncharacterized protein n=1 Tax=Callosobruchus maculatus TaxID=64391 RepID=A0A653DMS9_CALMS|nr:unnamed protein product [Callosobruchus maculatus]
MVPENSKEALIDKNRGRKRKRTLSVEELTERKRLWHRLFNKYWRLSRVKSEDCLLKDISEQHFLTIDDGILNVEPVSKKNKKFNRYQEGLVDYVENSLASPLRFLLLNRSICSNLGEVNAHMYWHGKIITEMSSLRMKLSKKNIIEYIKICDIINRTLTANIMNMDVKMLVNHILEMRRKSVPAYKIVNDVAILGDPHNVIKEEIPAYKIVNDVVNLGDPHNVIKEEIPAYKIVNDVVNLGVPRNVIKEEIVVPNNANDSS